MKFAVLLENFKHQVDSVHAKVDELNAADTDLHEQIKNLLAKGSTKDLHKPSDTGSDVTKELNDLYLSIPGTSRNSL